VIGVEAVPLAVRMNGRRELVVDLLENLAGPPPAASAPAASAGERYYRGRLDAIARLLAGVVTSSGRAASPAR
jgi:hypothetical protein